MPREVTAKPSELGPKTVEARSRCGWYHGGMRNPAASEPPKRKLYRLSPEDEAEVRAGLEDVEAGRVVELTPEELAEWEATGEMPAAVEQRFAALECSESRS